MHDASPQVIIVAGPNGAGKSTIARHLVRDTFNIKKYVNADTIARGLAAFDPESVDREAGRIMLEWLHHLADRRDDFAFETTLAGRKDIRFIKNELRQQGYSTRLFFVWLRSPELAIERVKQRVAEGGHSISEDVIRRRYRRGRRNFHQVYKHLVDEWCVCDNSTFEYSVMAEKENNSPPYVYQPPLWQQFCEGQEDENEY